MFYKAMIGLAAWFALMWLACKLMRFADEREASNPPTQRVEDPHPITPRFITLAVIVFALACFASFLGDAA